MGRASDVLDTVHEVGDTKEPIHLPHMKTENKSDCPVQGIEIPGQQVSVFRVVTDLLLHDMINMMFHPAWRATPHRGLQTCNQPTFGKFHMNRQQRAFQQQASQLGSVV